MTINFRETTALLREAESRDNLAAALKGGKAAKEFLQEREALAEAVGGVKKLAKADNVLADANTKASEIVAKGEVDAKALIHTADFTIKKLNAESTEKQQRLGALQTSLDALRASLGVKSQEVKDAAETVEEREKSAVEHEGHLERREAEVGARENETAAREAEIKRFDDWRATAPA